MLIQIILIVAVVVASAFLIRGTQDTKNVALRRLLLLLFVLAAVATIVAPNIATRAARLLGVGRGADLLLYMLVVAFLSYAVVSYRRMVILENRLVSLARELAIARSHPDTLTRLGEFSASADTAGAVVHGQAAPEEAEAAAGNAEATDDASGAESNSAAEEQRGSAGEAATGEA